MRWARWIAGLVIVALLVAAPPAVALISLLGIKNSMVEFLLEQLSTEGVFEITADRVEEPSDGVTAITGLSIADADGIWLTVDSLNFAWNPTRLLRGEVEFNNLSATGITVLRQPVIPDGQENEALDAATPSVEEGAFVWPRSPLDLRIDRLALEGVTIAEPVLGHAIAFDAEGAAQDEGDIQSARLDLRRTDTVRGVIAFDYARNFADNTLSVSLNADEAADGLVANLADLPRDAASRLSLSADGPPEDWRVAFELGLAELVSASGTAQIAYEGPVRVMADFSARPGPRMAPNLAALFGSQARMIARAREGTDGTIEIEQGQLISPHARLDASGTFNRISSAADLSVMLNASAGLAEPFDGVDFTDVSFRGRLTGAPGTFAADGQARVAGLMTVPVDLGTADLGVSVRQSGPDDAVTTELDVSGTAQGLRLDKIPATTIGTAETTLVASLTGDALTLQTFSVDSRVLSLGLAGEANIATQDAAVSFAGASPALAAVLTPYGVDVQGAATISGEARRKDEALTLDFDTALSGFAHELADARELELSGTVEQSGDRTAFDLTGNGQALRIDRIGPDLLTRADLTATGALQGDRLRLTRLDLDAPLLSARLNGVYNLGTQAAELNYRVTTPDLGRVARRYDVPASGRISANGTATLTGPDAAPRLAGNFAATGFAFDGTRYGNLDLAHDVRVSETPQGRVDLRFRKSPYGDGRVQTRFALNQPRLTLGGLDANVLGMRARGDLDVNLDAPTARGTLTVAEAQLSRLKPFTGVDLKGRAKGVLRLSAPGGRQGAVVDLDVTGLATDGLTARSATIKGEIGDVLGTPRVDARLSAVGVDAGEIALDRVALSARGGLAALDLVADATGGLDGEPLILTTAARINAANPTVQATIQRLEAGLGENRLRLNAPVAVTARGTTVSAKGLDLSLPGAGFLAGDVTYHGGPLSGDVRIRVPDLGILNRMADLPVQTGSLDAEMTFDTRSGSAGATGEVFGRALMFEGVDAAGAINLDARLDWQGRTAAIDGTVRGGFGAPVALRAEVPVRVANGIPGLAPSGPVSGAVAWKGNIDQLWALVPAPGHILTGEATVDLGVTGDIADPQITGGAQLRDGGYQNLDLGTILTDLALETSLSGGDLGLTLTAADGAKGTVRTTGRFAIDASGLDLTTDVNRAVLVRRDDVTARIGGQVRVQGPLTGLSVTGALEINGAEVRLVNANPPAIVDLGDVIIKGAPELPEEDSGGRTDLDLTITAPGRIFVRGRGLDSEWGMNLAIRGRAAEPVVTGRIERVRGRLDLIGKGFDLSRGRIDFDGNTPIDPRIDVVLERDSQNLTGRIIVEGQASDPTLRFASTPALPEDEVLPRVLFGKSSQALTGSQAIQLGIGLATLMDGGAGTLDRVRNAVGVDQLRVEQDEDGNAAVAVGKEVAEGVWVGSKQSLGDGGTSVVVEIDVFDNITIDTEVKQSGSSSIGIEWKKDF